MTNLDKAVDAFFDARPGWSRFNLEHCFCRGWENHMRGYRPSEPGGGFVAHTTERLVYDAGRLAAATHLLVDHHDGFCCSG
jgi:hypothetical protein